MFELLTYHLYVEVEVLHNTKVQNHFPFEV